MYLNPTASLAHSRNYTALFYSELENNPAPSWIALVFYILLSSVRTEVLAFTKGFPQMREWIGPRKVQSLSEYEISITKKDHELTVGVSRDDIFFDRFQIIGDKIRGIVTAVPRHFVKYFVDLCLGGFNTKSYDGQYFFDTDHPNGPGAVYVNTTNQAISATEWETAKARATKIKNPDSGAPLLIRWTHLFFAPNAWTAQAKLFGRERIDGGDTNIHQNAIPAENRTLVQEFGDSAKWFLFDLSKAIKPFLMQIVKGLDFVPFDKPTDWVVFQDRQYVYGIDTMDNATYLLPEVAYGSSVA
jgi:phage major head subunit gpT-like protein